MLAGLEGLSLPQAAAAVGVCATAFKRACRRLGVARWAYHRRSGKRGAGTAAGSHSLEVISSPAAAGDRPEGSEDLASGMDVEGDESDGGCGAGIGAWLAGESSGWLDSMFGEYGFGEETRCGPGEAGYMALGEGTQGWKNDLLVLEMLAWAWPGQTNTGAGDGPH
jgi:hypothetical protein